MTTMHNDNPSLASLAGQRAVVVGLGIEGIALARFLAGRGARVLVTDAKPAEALADRTAALRDVPVEYALGGTDPALAARADALYVSQSVPLTLPLVAAARELGVPVRSILTLVYDLCPGPIAAVTGSSGKTTTTSLLDAMFTAAGRDHILAGNIGVWPLDALANATRDRWAVMEVSHTQLQLTDRSPRVACVTNVTPNHLDQFSWDEYVALKRNHVAHQRAGDVAVLNYDDAITREFAGATSGRPVFFSMHGAVPGDGAVLRDEIILWRQNGAEQAVVAAREVPLRGRHNIENVLAATATAGAAGLPMEAVGRAVRGFRAPAHRLEPVAVVRGVHWYNDSIATTPERTLAGLRSFSEPVVLLLGGRDKHLPLEELATVCRERCRAVVTFGDAGPLFAAAMRAGGVGVVQETADVAAAVREAAALATPGDVALFAPAGTSFDAYANFERRGEHFRRLVQSLAEEAP